MEETDDKAICSASGIASGVNPALGMILTSFKHPESKYPIFVFELPESITKFIFKINKYFCTTLILLMKYPEKVIIGLMSGTSLDGLDIAACLFSCQNEQWNFQLLKADTIEYDLPLKKKLSGLMAANALEYVQTDFEFGYYIGNQVRRFLDKNELQADLIASHGHTVFHQPQSGFTAQIGHGACIAARTGLPVVYDFRSLDVALHGQGAPLVPIGDQLLFSDFDFCLNLGGIANISFDNIFGDRIAYDICPVNMVLNALAGKLDKPYDENGSEAASGKLQSELLQKLDGLDFYALPGPKSLGREWVEKKIFPLLHQYDIPIADKLHTFCLHIANQIHKTLRSAPNKNGKLLITGGGAFNTFLIDTFKHTFPGEIKIHLPDHSVIEYKEAIIFAFLGYLRSLGLTNTLSTVTGADRNSCSGAMMA